MERELRIYEMSDAANPMSLARSRLLNERFPTEYTATRARRAVSLKGGKYSNDDLWSFVMLPDAPAVSGLPSLLPFLRHTSAVLTTVLSAEGDRRRPAVCSPTPQARAAVRAAQRREPERVARKKEKRIRRWERREWRDEEFRLREQQGLSPPATSEDSSSGEEEEEEGDGGQALPERWEPAPPSPRAAEAAEGQVSGAGMEALAARQFTGEAACTAEAPARTAVASGSAAPAATSAATTSGGVATTAPGATVMSGSAATAATGATVAPAEPSKKRKRGFSTLSR
jgi:hypothetical protein